jgi:hypothetical protein
MALSDTFPAPTKPQIRPTATRSLIPITARELVEWTYAVQRAQGVPELSLEPQGRSQTGIVVDRMIEFAQLGCRVDVSSSAAAIWGEAHCDEDAMTVHGIVEGLPARKRDLLIRQGLLRSAPEWDPMILPLRCVPVPGRKGKPKGIYAHHGKTHIGSEITYEGDWPDRVTEALARAAWPDGPRLRCADEVIEYARAVYGDWSEALASLRDWFAAAGKRGLRRYRIESLGAAREPWRA